MEQIDHLQTWHFLKLLFVCIDYDRVLCNCHTINQYLNLPCHELALFLSFSFSLSPFSYFFLSFIPFSIIVFSSLCIFFLFFFLSFFLSLFCTALFAHISNPPPPLSTDCFLYSCCSLPLT